MNTLGLRIHVMNPLILIPVLLVISLNLFAHVSREWCNSTLRVLRLYAKFAASDFRYWSAPPPPSHTQPPLSTDNSASLSAQTDCFSDLQSLLQNFPVDLRTLMDRFGMQAKIDVYAVCPDPKCCAVYAPVTENGVKNISQDVHQKAFAESWSRRNVVLCFAPTAFSTGGAFEYR